MYSRLNLASSTCSVVSITVLLLVYSPRWANVTSTFPICSIRHLEFVMKMVPENALAISISASMMIKLLHSFLRRASSGKWVYSRQYRDILLVAPLVLTNVSHNPLQEHYEYIEIMFIVLLHLSLINLQRNAQCSTVTLTHLSDVSELQWTIQLLLFINQANWGLDS